MIHGYGQSLGIRFLTSYTDAMNSVTMEIDLSRKLTFKGQHEGFVRDYEIDTRTHSFHRIVTTQSPLYSSSRHL